MSDFEVELDAVMKRHGVVAYAVAAESERKLYSFLDFNNENSDLNQRSKFMISAVCARLSEKIRTMAFEDGQQ